VPAAASSTPEVAPAPPVVTEPVTEPVTEVGLAVPSAPIPFVRREERARDLEATVEAAISTLADQLSLGHTAGYLDVLGFYGRFHRYSISNTLLIRAQRPEARLVAGMKRWNSLGYRIRSGERATWIWAPVKKRSVDEVTGEIIEGVVGFRPAPVFADGQLLIPQDKPLPTLFRRLPDDCHRLYEAARQRVVAAGIDVAEVDLPTGIQGASVGGRVLIKAGLDSRSKVLVLAHEVSHELAHHGDESDGTSRQIRELEAESVAFVVGRVLGVDNPFSADYLINYGIEPEALKAALTTVQRLVRRVVAIIAPDDGEEEVRRAA